jgi:hypothetical protein
MPTTPVRPKSPGTIDPTTDLAAPLAVRPMASSDLAFAYRLAATVRSGWHRVSREGLPTPPHFPAFVFQTAVACFVVEAHGTPVGMCTFYDWFPQHEVLWFDAPCLPDTDPDVMAEAVLRCVRDVGSAWPFRRLFTEFAEHARPAFDALDELLVGPTEEGRLAHAVFEDNWYWDLVVVGFTRPNVGGITMDAFTDRRDQLDAAAPDPSPSAGPLGGIR